MAALEAEKFLSEEESVEDAAQPTTEIDQSKVEPATANGTADPSKKDADGNVLEYRSNPLL